MRSMIIKQLIEKYFDNKVRTIPYGAGYFFQALDEIEYILETPGLVHINKCDLCELFSKCDNLIITFDPSKVGPIIDPIFPTASPSPFKNKPSKVFFNITGGPEMSLYEVNDIAEEIYKSVDEDADILFSALIDENMDSPIKTTVILGN